MKIYLLFYLKKKKKYLGSDDNGNLSISYEKDWFQFYSEVNEDNFIKTTEEYRSDYFYNHELSNDYIDMEIGANGNPLIIKSLKTGKYLNSYKEIDNWDLPWIDVERDTFNDSMHMENKDSTNLFIPKTDDGLLSIASYQTLPIRSIVNQDWKKFYPTITSTSNNELILKQNMNSHELPIEDVKTEVNNNSQIALLPNPTNETQYAIYFVEANSFVRTEKGKLTLEKSPDLNDKEKILNLEYFEFEHSPKKNPEFFEFIPVIDTPSSTMFQIATEFPEKVDGYEFRAWGFEEFDINNIEGMNAEHYLYKEIPSNGESYKRFTQKGLKPEYTYIGALTMWREDDFVGKHKSTVITVPFGDFPDIGGGGGGGIDPTLPVKPIDPGKPDKPVDPDKPIPIPSENIRLWESIDEVGPNNSNGPSNDINKSKMFDYAWNTTEISIDFVKGEGTGIADKIRFKLEEVDSSNNPVAGSEIIYSDSRNRPATGTYTFRVEDLKEDTKYKVTTQYFDNSQLASAGEGWFDQIQSTALGLDEGIEQMYITTEAKAPEKTFENFWHDFSKNELTVTLDLENIDLAVDKIRFLGEPSLNDGTAKTIDTGYINMNTLLNPTQNRYTYQMKGFTAGKDYDINIWIKIDGYEGWEGSPVWDSTQDNQSPGGFQYIKLFEGNLNSL